MLVWATEEKALMHRGGGKAGRDLLEQGMPVGVNAMHWLCSAANYRHVVAVPSTCRESTEHD